MIGDLVRHDIVKKEAKEQIKNKASLHSPCITRFFTFDGHDHINEKDQLRMEN